MHAGLDGFYQNKKNNYAGQSVKYLDAEDDDILDKDQIRVCGAIH
jgi:hypothetical protein